MAEEGDEYSSSSSSSSPSPSPSSSDSDTAPPPYYDIPVHGAASQYTLRILDCGRHMVLTPMLTHLPTDPEVLATFGGAHVVSSYLGTVHYHTLRT
jgi:hypothetical protein